MDNFWIFLNAMSGIFDEPLKESDAVDRLSREFKEFPPDKQAAAIAEMNKVITEVARLASAATAASHNSVSQHEFARHTADTK